MPIGITDEHLALHDAVRGWIDRHCTPDVPRALLDAPAETLPPFWADLGAQGWLGLHLDEAHGGSGYGVRELAVVLEELGRAIAPGPFLPTVLAAAVVQASGNEAAQKELLPGLASGEVVGAVGGGPGCGLSAEETADGLVVRGTIGPLVGAHLANLIVAPAGMGDHAVWVALSVGEGVTVRELPSVDQTRRVGEVVVDQARVPPERRLDGISAAFVLDAMATLASRSSWGAQWCVTPRPPAANDL